MADTVIQCWQTLC